MRLSRFVKTLSSLAAGMVLLLLLPVNGEAVSWWIFTKIADTNTPIPGGTGNFAGFDQFSAAIDGGNVAFRGFGTDTQGIYTFIGGALAKVADTNTSIPGLTGNFNGGFSAPSIDEGNVAFMGTGSSGSGIYTDIGGSLNVVADTNTPVPGGAGNFTGGFNNPSLNGGNVVFHGLGASSHRGLYTDIGGALNVVADTNTPIPGWTGNFHAFSIPSLDGGNVVFRGEDSSEQQGLYTNIGGSLNVVADTSTPIPGGTGNFIEFLSVPSLDDGNIAFVGLGASSHRGVYTDIGGTLNVVADMNTPMPGWTGNFHAFNFPSFDGGNIAFEGRGSTIGKRGIYIDIGDSLMKVIARFDTLDGKTATDVRFGAEGLSGNSLVFYATFTDTFNNFSSGIYRADPIPEPATLLLLGSGLVGLGLVRRRRRGSVRLPTNESIEAFHPLKPPCPS